MRSHAKAASSSSTHRENSAFSLGVLAAMLVCAAAFLGIGAPAASAAPEAQPGYGYLTSFGGGAPFTRVRNAVAVDSHGNIFVSNEDKGKIAIYAADATAGGTELTTISPSNFYPADVAIDLSTDAVYAQDIATLGVVRRFLSDGQPTPAYTLDPTFEVPAGEGIAVDPTTHDLLVADPGAEGVRRYNSSGTLLGTIATPGMGPQRLAVAPDGSIYFAQESSQSIVHISGTGTQLGEVQSVGAIIALAFDPTRDLLVADTGDRLKVFSASGDLLSEAVPPNSGGSALTIDGNNGRLYEYRGKSPLNAYVPAVYPGIEGPAVSNVTAHSVHLSAAVEPGDPLPDESKAHFEYSADGGETWKPLPGVADQNLTEAGVVTVVEADLTGLFANFDYLVRFVASNRLAIKRSDPVAVSTATIAPEVVTAKATDVSESSAVLNGTVNPSGLQTTYHFEYGLTDAYGSRVPAGIEAAAGNGFEPRAFGRTIRGLDPGTTYHFRIVAENEIGVSEGADETFTTVPAAGTPFRAYEQVTPADKHGIAIEYNYGFFARADGNGMAYITKGGGSGAPLNARSITFRGAEDWEPGPDLDPPLGVNSNGIITQATLGLSPDFTKAFVVSNEELTPDAAGGEAANLYIFDIASGEYTLVGSTPDFFLALNFYTGYGGGGQFLASAPDMSWMVFYSQMPLIEGAAFNSLYRWSEADGLEIVSILPGPTETPATIFEIGAYSRVFSPVSADGTKIYFQSVEPEPGVYLRENGETKAISVSEVPGEPTGVRPALLIGTSEDGRYAFFATNEPNVKLTSDAPGEYGDAYRYDASDGSLEYLGAALLGGGSDPYHSGLGISRDGGTFYFRANDGLKVWREGDLQAISPSGAGSEYSASSPDGRYLAFSGSESGANDARLYFYDAVTEELSCASCLPDGTPGEASLPNLINRTIGEHLPQSVTNSGQFFFTSSSRLVAADVNGVNDVYEFKSGKARLVTPGNAPFPATFADISEDGRDVFFTTQQKLVGRDNDQSVDIYDARIDGGLPAQSPPPPQECLRDDCKATPNAGPELPFGGSEALSGPGNVNPPKHKKCGKGKKGKKVNGKVRCVKKHKANKAGKGGNR
ncbi:MAG TPA: hypothetical protein VLK37_12610 [Solirubrobacterales bacterium]|nr:hypothetical protein [Solirubrobacterales bacterium]